MSLLLPLTLATLLTTDPLGYECVPEDRLEAAFSLGGKAMRAPQTCIPEPCQQTLTEATLANYSGYRDAALYGDYRRRMSDVCGTPTAWEEKGITDKDLLWAVFDGDSGPIPLQDPGAWDVAAVDWTDPFQTFPGDGGGKSGGFSGFSGFGGGFGGGGGRKAPGSGKKGGPQPVTSHDADDPTFRPQPERPSEVPLPAPFLLLSCAAAALVLLKRCRRRTMADRPPGTLA